MKLLNTFYDTLQVSRSANDSVLQEAYKTLCQKYHPDKNPEDLDGATQDMLLLNKAYEVLSDSDKRLEYDLWIIKREREMRAQEEREAAEAEARKPMFPPIVMPPDPPEAPTPASSSHVQPPPAPKPPSAPSASPTPPAQTPKTSVPSAVARPPAEPPGFADTQPQGAEKPVASGSAPRAAVPHPLHALREPRPPSAVADAVDWLRERPVWLLSVVLAAVLLIAFAPWLKHVSLGSAKPIAPITPDLQPTYVEPPASASPSAPVALPVPGPASEAQPLASDNKPVRNAKPQGAAATQRRLAVGKKPPEPEAPSQSREPVVPPPVQDPGGHTGFAPKCRWVTPTRWSCD